jgi:hypothetical protein
MLLPNWLAMTQKTSPAEPPVVELKSVDKKQISIEEIVESLKSVGDDIVEIIKLTSEERLLVAQFLASLKHVQQPMFSIAVSTSVLPIGIGVFTQAHIDSTGHLILTFEDGHLELKDLSETKNRDLMMAVIDDIMPKFKNLTSQIAGEKLQKPSQIQEISPPEPLPTINVTTPVGLVDSDAKCVQEEVPVLSADENAQIAEITAETFGNLELLGNEVFEYSPVSMYFDDWMVNLRQVILSFESNELIGPDETFTNEYNQIFGNIEEELAKRLATEADIEVSARTLVENRYLLNKIDEGYAAQTKELVVKGKSAIDYLTRNVQQLEAELTEVAQIKVSFRHPLQKLAKDQKLSELTQKLNAAKKRLALAVGTSSVDQGKAGGIDSEYAAQTQELADKRKSALDILSKEVQELEAKLAEIEKIKTSNPITKTAIAQKRFDTTQKLIAAKKRLELAEQNSNTEQEKLKAEYEKKKQATLGKMQNIEKEIATKAVDNSAEVRKAATNALANAVKSLIQRKAVPSQ